MTKRNKRGRVHSRDGAQSTHTNKHSVRSINGNRIRAAKRTPYLDKRGRMSNRARAGSRKCWIAKELYAYGATWSYGAANRKDLEKPMPSDHSIYGSGARLNMDETLTMVLHPGRTHGSYLDASSICLCERNPNHSSNSWTNTWLLRLIRHMSLWTKL
jgi:hypothetical protein